MDKLNGWISFFAYTVTCNKLQDNLTNNVKKIGIFNKTNV